MVFHPAAGHGYIDPGPVDLPDPGHDPADIDGGPLGRVPGGGITELDVLAQIPRGQRHRGAGLVESAGAQAAIVVDLFDLPALPVAHHIPSSGGQLVVVAAGEDHITDMGLRLARQSGGGAGEVMAVGFQVSGLGHLVKYIHILPGGGHQEGIPPVLHIRHLSVQGIDEHRRGGAGMQAALLRVPVRRALGIRLITIAQLLGG